MSLYTPVFPHTDAPVGRSSSSSLASVESHKQSRVLSYSSRLSQWHLAIASLPEELCPPSTPSSPTSQDRSVKLQSEIQQAVHHGRNITDFCKLRSSKLGYATKQVARDSVEQGDDAPWILAETEEEWFDWERKMAQRRRTRQKGKGLMTTDPPPPNIQSQSAHDKVLNWKARLEPVNAPLVPPSTFNNSLLSFPVVKRSLLRKDSKAKDSRSTSQIGSAPRPNSIMQTVGEQALELRVDTRSINAVRMDTGDVVHGNSSTNLKLATSNSPPEAKEAPSFAEPENAYPELCDFSTFPPSSFPSDLPTSTQKNDTKHAWSAYGPPPSFPLDLPTSTLRDTSNWNEIIKADTQQEPLTGRPPAPGDEVPRNGINSNSPEQQAPQPTPPTPPYSSETSQPPDAPTSASDRHIPVTPPRKHTRPLTPPPEVRIPVAFEAQGSPHTPKQDRAGQHTSLSGIGHGSRGSRSGNVDINGHVTPDAAINGVSVLRDTLGMYLAYPSTPEQQRQSLPDPLTTSRKSRPRPRPPSRKHSMQGMDIDVVEGAASVDPSPTKSDRSYFSSPASGSSSGSELGSVNDRLVIPGSPTSPLGLGFGFTQNPGRFVPLAESTQALRPDSGSPRSKTRPESGSGSLNHKLFSSQSQSRSQSQGQNQKNGLSMYNSQFDVDARVDQLSNFMRRDVDLDAWVLNTSNANTDEEAEEGAVEEMTMTYPEHTSLRGS